MNLKNELAERRRRVLETGRALILMACLGLAHPAWSQPVPEGLAPGSIGGVVEDRDGAVYEGVQITLERIVSGSEEAPMPDAGALTKRTAISDSNGHFLFSDVAAGGFRLTISSKGFASQVVAGILHSGENYEAKAIVLPVHSASSEVRVNASQVEIAQEQLRVEETQRVLGVIPNFFVTYVPNAAPLSIRQKYSLAWKTSIDPISFAAAGVFAGIEQADNTFSGYGQGAQGYGKRFGAAYADGFFGTMIGGAVLPSMLKQDPRYFYKGTGTTRSRVLYAIANAVICKGDNGRWQANYSGILGGLAAGGISNLYYPASDRDGVGLTFENTLIGTAAGAVQNLFQEFVVRKFTPKLSNYGTGKP
jgi:hypothetical protein